MTSVLEALEIKPRNKLVIKDISISGTVKNTFEQCIVFWLFGFFNFFTLEWKEKYTLPTNKKDKIIFLSLVSLLLILGFFIVTQESAPTAYVVEMHSSLRIQLDKEQYEPEEPLNGLLFVKLKNSTFDKIKARIDDSETVFYSLENESSSIYLDGVFVPLIRFGLAAPATAGRHIYNVTLENMNAWMSFEVLPIR